MLRKLYLVTVIALFLACIGCKAPADTVEKTAAFAPSAVTPGATETRETEIVVYYVIQGANPHLVREVHLAPDSGNPLMTAVNEVLRGVPTTTGAQAVFPKSLACLACRSSDGTAEITLTKDLFLSDAEHDVLALAVIGLVNTLTEHESIDSVHLKVDDVPEVDVDIWLTSLGFQGQPLRRDTAMVLEPPIWVEEPAPNQAVACPVSVKGSAIVPDGIVELRLTTEAGEILAETIVETASDNHGRVPFETEIIYTHPASGRGFLEVFRTDPRYGQEKDKVVIPVDLRGSGVSTSGP